MLQSLSSRVAVTAGVVLFVFLGSAAWVLDRAFSDAAFTAVRERLQGRMFMILGLAELDSPVGQLCADPRRGREARVEIALHARARGAAAVRGGGR
jgi:hypothetical protein